MLVPKYDTYGKQITKNWNGLILINHINTALE